MKRDDQIMSEELLVRKNIGLVVSQAVRFKPTRVTDHEDYQQAGAIGLLRAIRNYDKSKGKLSTFAWSAIRNEIVREFRRFQDETVDLDENFDVCEVEHENFDECLPATLSNDELALVLMRAFGFKNREISVELGYSKEKTRILALAAYNKIRDSNT